MRCQRCAGEQFVKAGFDRVKRQMHRCTACKHRQTARSISTFCGYRFPDDIIALAVRWYLRFRLPYADMSELLAESGVHVDPSTIFDWVQRFTPIYKEGRGTAALAARWGALVDRRDLHPHRGAVVLRLSGTR